MERVYIGGEWKVSQGKKSFHATNPNTRQPLPQEFPTSPWEEIEEAIDAAADAYQIVRNWPGDRFAAFLEAFATAIEANAENLAQTAHLETALPYAPRLKDVELPRTINQLRLGAAAARDGSWTSPVIDVAAGLRTQLGSIGPVVVFGPNNFPFAFNGISGGDFAAAVAAGNPVIAKGHPLHPETTRLLAVAAGEAALATGMPAGFVQMIYRTSHEDGAKLVSHPKIAASGYTGGRSTGLALKHAADLAGKPFYAELSSINPVYILPGVLEERFDAMVTDFVGSCLMGTGQFCTNPGLVILKKGDLTEKFIQAAARKFDEAPVGTLFSEGSQTHLQAAIIAIQQAGAHVTTSSLSIDSTRFCNANTLLRVSGEVFLENPESLQTEAFGNSSLIVVCKDDNEIVELARHFEGNLTGCIYSSTTGCDDELYSKIEPGLRQKVGRLINDKMPTGVAVSPAMNHGGPYPATSHSGFTAVGIPAAMRRFAMLQCYDNVRSHRLPAALRDQNPTGKLWRQINGNWTQGDVQ
ncbi:aldehyde dehydrogenase (NADP(+)) [Planctomicrobium sp. SH668]|uniref:aldehyde dehydrogenase (NADP(+)) n=1 Tax=Planctomicrobium sp. SH668 TaxID=3448126 RepID=UPI003F5C9584